MLRSVCAVGFLLASLVCSRAEPCSDATSVRQLAACAAASHPLVTVEREKLAAVAGARVTAAVILPAHPELSFSMAERRLWQPANATPVLNFYLTLSQKIEVSGARSARLAVADAETKAQLKRAAITELTVAAETADTALAWAASVERIALGEELRTVADRLAAVAEARRESALISELEATLLTAEATRITFEIDEMTLAESVLRSRLRSLIGGEPTVLSLPTAPALADGAWVERGVALRGDLAALAAEADAQTALATQLERERAPLVTVSAFLQSDGFGERVIGAGLSLPLFLPSPLGPSRRGEIEAARARAREKNADAAARERRIKEEIAAAALTLRTRERQASSYDEARMTRARTQLVALVDAVAAGKIGVRDGLVATHALLDLLDRSAQSRLAVWHARVALARAAALPLEEVLP